MEYKCNLKTATVVWWRFFWRYAVVFISVILFAGIGVNLCKGIQPHYLYAITLLSGFLANVFSTLLGFFYCLNRKFRKSSLILQGKSEHISPLGRLWIWFLYFWRFSILAIAIAAALGYMLPLCFQYVGIDPVKALKYSKYLGNISMLPASYLAFISLICRKEKRQTLRIAVSE